MEDFPGQTKRFPEQMAEFQVDEAVVCLLIGEIQCLLFLRECVG